MPDLKYISYSPRPFPSTLPINYYCPRLPNVRSAFEAIYDSADTLALCVADQIPGDRYLKGKNHFQGIARLQNSRYLILSGGDDKLGCGHLFVGRLDSRPATGAWRTNLFFDDTTPAGDNLDKLILTLNLNDASHGIDSRLWHVGGISVSCDVLAAPIECPDGDSVVMFYNFNDPERPAILSRYTRIERPARKAGAVAMVDLANGHILVGVSGRHSSDGKHYLDLYLSKDAGWTKGFTQVDSVEVDEEIARLQNINFLMQEGETLYIVGTGNSDLAPVFNNDDSIYLYRLSCTHKAFDDLTSNDKVEITVNRVMTRKLRNKVISRVRRKFSPFQSNMCASGGCHVSPNGTLAIYSSYHWRHPKDKSQIRFSEFSTDHSKIAPAAIHSISDSWVELFVDSNFMGIRLGLSGARDIAQSDLSKAVAQGHHFGKRLSSLKCLLPANTKLVLYSRRNFDPRDGHLEILGEGEIVLKEQLKSQGYDNKAMSCRLVPLEHRVTL